MEEGQRGRILSRVWPGSAGACYQPRPGSTGRTGTWAPCHSFSLWGQFLPRDSSQARQARWSPVVVLVQRWSGGPPGPSLGNRWFTKKCQGDTSIKKERCVYSMISTDQMHIHRMKVKPVSDSRVWPTLRHQRRGVEWVLMAHVNSPRAPITKFFKKWGKGQPADKGQAPGREPLPQSVACGPWPPVPASCPGPSFPG